ncbi:MAG: hypothetical protein A2784_02480 [Candidatus Chisholmbacteria bacterium RIFCSPHIGHO2_01_FULL_48_12]|uniref:Uncharacterized protein n=1 Tax=Candidatus Chisholmbacteria bacterium RIFCSPHIGHO2_01_FULL_48_12 TaxID=1797589 RepID=A0A1G1VPP6_9BACT|nr:MAG: hypothetical protein A2784_02480 [Candidatus Chisholmbacteria bacterium RIFCSPHIGHO2_01_FULL_48_12]
MSKSKESEGRVTVIDVQCKNGHLLFESYQKVGRGRLWQCYFDKMSIDNTGSQKLEISNDVYCPESGCGLRIGRVANIRGRMAVKLNQGGIKQIRI